MNKATSTTKYLLSNKGLLPCNIYVSQFHENLGGFLIDTVFFFKFRRELYVITISTGIHSIKSRLGALSV